MSTPTPMKLTASQQGRTPSQLAAATPPVTTPFSNPAQAAFSPRGSRSSPQQYRKSPAATMIGQMAGGALNFDSPSTFAAFGGQPLMDHEFEQQNQRERAFASEADKVKRLEEILEIINKKKGLVSEVGLERLATQNGFDCLAEDLTASDGRKMKTLIIAGSITQIDIILDGNVVQNVTLAFPGLNEATAKLMEPASRILLRDLKLQPDQSPLTKSLDRFAMNLERLGRLDQLSISEAGFFCHEALVGLYKSLDQLHKWDVAKLRGDLTMSGKSDEYFNRLAMCTKHGLPEMHVQDRVGLALKYWSERRFIPPSNDQMALFSEKNEKTWSLIIECKAMQGYELAPARVSENWISNDIVKQDSSLDWQEPGNFILPVGEDGGRQGKGVDMMLPDLTTKRIPQVKFTVSFDPPVILTHADWMRLHNCVGLDAQPLLAFPPTFDVMHFPVPPGAPHNASELRTIKRQRRVRVFDKDGNESEKIHRNTLFNYKRIYAMSTTELSFTHPSQLIAMLPILRQYAFISILLNKSFGDETEEYDMAAAQKEKEAKPKDLTNTVTEKDELTAFLESTTETYTETRETSSNPRMMKTSGDKISMDVSLGVHPTPHLKVVFPFGESTANIEMQILPNGVVDVVNENVLHGGDDGDKIAAAVNGNIKANSQSKDKRQLTRGDLGRVLEHMEDLCQWAEWIRTRLG